MSLVKSANTKSANTNMTWPKGIYNSFCHLSICLQGHSPRQGVVNVGWNRVMRRYFFSGGQLPPKRATHAIRLLGECL